VMPAI